MLKRFISLSFCKTLINQINEIYQEIKFAINFDF